MFPLPFEGVLGAFILPLPLEGAEGIASMLPLPLEGALGAASLLPLPLLGAEGAVGISMLPFPLEGAFIDPFPLDGPIRAIGASVGAAVGCNTSKTIFVSLQLLPTYIMIYT